jgi:hypothetical protein
MSETVASATEPNSDPNVKAWSPKLIAFSIASIVGLALGAIIVGAINPFFPFENLPELGISPSPELVKKHIAATYAFHSMNLGLNLGLMGLCFGIAFGSITAQRNRPLATVAGGLGGLVAGVLAGYLVGLYVAKAFIASADQSLVESTLIHFSSWLGILACVVLIVGYSQAGMTKAAAYLVAGIVAAMLLAVAYNLVTSILFPKANLLSVIPSTVNERIVWILVCSLTVTCGLYFGLKDKPATATEARG